MELTEEEKRILDGEEGEPKRVAMRILELPGGTVDRLFEFLRSNVNPSAQSSMLQDLLAGRRLEVEYLNSAAVRLGRKLEIATPINFVIYAALKPYVQGSPSASR